MPAITLLTDFGLSDTFAGAMKGVILSIAPQAQIADLSHAVPPQDVTSGALLLDQACRYFPLGTIHVAVVDPGVGSARRALAIQTERYFFVGPDNGVLSLALRNERVLGAASLNNPQYHRQPVSSTFHGRDIFAPVAAHLAAGVALKDLGAPVDGWVEISPPQPVVQGAELKIHVLRVDHFGNLLTDLARETYLNWNRRGLAVAVTAGAARIEGLRGSFSEVPGGAPLAYFGSDGLLEIAVNGGRADQLLALGPGAVLRLGFFENPSNPSV